MAKSYEQLNDEELCRLAADDSGAEEYLLIKYKRLVLKESRSLFLNWGDRDDLLQEGMIGLYRAIQSYRPESGASFVTFATLCVRRQIYNAIEAANRKKNIPLEGYISIDSPEYLEQEQESGHGAGQAGPLEQLIDREEAERLLGELKGKLSPLEKKVLDDYIEGNNYQEIARKLGKTPKSVDNAVTRIKSKFREILEQEGRASRKTEISSKKNKKS